MITSQDGWIVSNGGDTSTLKTEEFKLKKGDVVEIEGEGIHREVSGGMGKNENGWFPFFVKSRYGNIPYPGRLRWLAPGEHFPNFRQVGSPFTLQAETIYFDKCHREVRTKLGGSVRI